MTTWKKDVFTYNYEIANSVWLDGTADKMQFTQVGSVTDATTFTMSAWVKRSALGAEQVIFGSTNSTNDSLHFDANDDLIFEIGGADQLVTDMKFRDTSAWYHILLAYDSGQSVDKNEAKLYVNGKRVTSFSTELYTGTKVAFNVASEALSIGSTEAGGSYFNGYMSQVAWIDGTQYGPDSFGQFEKGVWVPKDLTGLTFGLNGFWLDFAIEGTTGATIGNDVSGVGNDMTTVTSFTAANQTEDTPTNNWCTLNPLDESLTANAVYTNGNTAIETSAAGADQGYTRSTFSVNSGKYYWEVLIGGYDVAGPLHALGITGTHEDVNDSLGPDGDASSYLYVAAGNIRNAGASLITGLTSYDEGDRIAVAFDADIGAIWFGHDNEDGGSLTWQNSATTGEMESGDVSNACASGIDMTKWYTPVIGDTNDNDQHFDDVNFGQNASDVTSAGADSNGYGEFRYAPPSGFLSLCSQNLPDPEILQGDEHFDVVLVDGNSTADRVMGNLKFSPAFIWAKDLVAAVAHQMYSKVVGVRNLHSIDGQTIDTDTATGVTSFNRNSVTAGTSINTANANVIFNWRMDEHHAGMSKGAGTSKPYSGLVNRRAGQALIGYESNATTGMEIPHGLSKPPEMTLHRCRTAGHNWCLGHNGMTSWDYYKFPDLATAQTNVVDAFNATPPSATTVTIGASNEVNTTAGNDYWMLAVHSVPGYSMVGSGEGNGNADGTFHWTGFEIGWLWVFDIDTAESSYVWDTTRSPINPAARYILPDGSTAEATANNIDFLSNGWKARSTTLYNVDAKTVCWYAVAKHPFKYANAR